MAKHHKGKKLNVNLGEAALTIVKANFMAYLVTAIFIILGTIILTYTKASPNVEKWIVFIGIIVSAFLAGFDTAKVETRNGYKWGAIGGSVYLVIFIILAAVLNGFKSFSMGTFVMVILLALLSSTLAGMLSVNSTK